MVMGLLLTGCTVGEVVKRTSETASPTPIVQTESYPELSIKSLQARKYQTKIVVGEVVRQTDKFVSKFVSYDSDGLQLNALMNMPTGKMPESGWPVVIVNHGYIPPDEYSTENSYINTSAYFANAGFLVLKPDYRGHDKSEGSASGLLSRSEYAIDVMNLIAGIIESIPEADENGIYLYGHSMGGEVSLIVLEVNPLIRAATLWAPATTSFPENALYFARKNRDGERTRKLSEKLSTIRPEDYALYGSIEYLDQVRVPINLHHGTRDESVPYAWGVALDKKLKEAGVEVNFYTYLNDTHDIPNNWGTALERDVELFRKI